MHCKDVLRVRIRSFFAPHPNTELCEQPTGAKGQPHSGWLTLLHAERVGHAEDARVIANTLAWTLSLQKVVVEHTAKIKFFFFFFFIVDRRRCKRTRQSEHMCPVRYASSLQRQTRLYENVRILLLESGG